MTQTVHEQIIVAIASPDISHPCGADVAKPLWRMPQQREAIQHGSLRFEKTCEMSELEDNEGAVSGV
jgi:hypothetical protein